MINKPKPRPDKTKRPNATTFDGRKIPDRPQTKDTTIIRGGSARPFFGLGVSGTIALACFLSLALLPWAIYERGEAVWMDLGAALLWLLLGISAAVVHGGYMNGRKGR